MLNKFSCTEEEKYPEKDRKISQKSDYKIKKHKKQKQIYGLSMTEYNFMNKRYNNFRLTGLV